MFREVRKMHGLINHREKAEYESRSTSGCQQVGISIVNDHWFMRV